MVTQASNVPMGGFKVLSPCFTLALRKDVEAGAGYLPTVSTTGPPSRVLAGPGRGLWAHWGPCCAQ